MSVDTAQSVFGVLFLYIPLTLLTFAVFRCAVRARTVNIAPKCAARSPDTIFNPNAKYAKKKKQKKYRQRWGGFLNLNREIQRNPVSKSEDVIDDEEEDHVQYRGGALFGWMFWVMRLSYEELLDGVPGTGTRNNGMDGSMLRINLDGIALLRFHAICLRVSVLATFLGLSIVLPIYMTARCGIDTVTDSYTCDQFVGDNNITDFEKGTIQNLFNFDNISNLKFDEIVGDYENVKWYHYIFGSNMKVWRSTLGSYLGRFYGVVIVSWILVCYTLKILRKEWVGALALRRIFYLEQKHWQRREKELFRTLSLDQGHGLNAETESNDEKISELDCPDRHIWVPHPEQQNNVANIELYSVLVENIPAMPSELSYDANDNANSIVDWQMGVITAFFDQCVVNQPGFSSSIAAITLLPDASKTALAWKRWKKYGASLRRLRYVRELINERLQNSSSKRMDTSECDDEDQQHLIKNDTIDTPQERRTYQYQPEWNTNENIQRQIMHIFGKEFNDVEHRKIEKEILMPQLSQYGPEQAAVLSKEFAMGSYCFPNGCCEKKLINLSVEELQDLEDELEEDVVKSCNELKNVHKSSLFHKQSSHQRDNDSRIYDTEMQLNLQQLTLSNQGRVKPSFLCENTEETAGDWEKVEQAIEDYESSSSHLSRVWNLVRSPLKDTFDAMNEIVSCSTVAIVTFTNRQAAIAARKCPSDGRGYGLWQSRGQLPIPPLADAPAFDITDYRGFCKPVTVTVNQKQRWLRYCVTIFVLALVYTLWSFPLVIFNMRSIALYTRLAALIPGHADILERSLATNIPSYYTTLFVAVASPLFQSLANFSGKALSVSQSELIALKYFWWFMVLSAFFGQSFTSLMLDYFNIVGNKDAEDISFVSLIQHLIMTIPTMSVVWLKWLITKCFVTTPLTYMLNVLAFVTHPFKCLQRPVLGGSGIPVPYKIAIESGFIFFILISLTPTLPAVAPFVLYYFLLFQPILRRNMLYIYRPAHDSGGIRWPFYADMLVSALVVAQAFLTITLIIRNAFGPAILAGLSVVPCFWHRKKIMNDFYDAYMDVSLLQCSQIDGWEERMNSSQEERERFRKFLVDAHKAAYVPICFAGDGSHTLTVEPAVVVPLESDIEVATKSINERFRQSVSCTGMTQRGVSWRRVASSTSVMSQAKTFK